MTLPELTIASSGWTLPEALERTADPDLWDAYAKARIAFQEAHRRIPSGPTAFIEKSREAKQRAKIALDAAFRPVKSDLWKHVIAGRLFAHGSRGGPGVPPSPVAVLGWNNLVVQNWEGSRMLERGEPAVYIHNVRLFPLVYDPEVVKRLAGLTLAEAFRKCVLEDPEVVSRGKRAPDLKKNSALLREGTYPGIGHGYRWSLDTSANNLGFHLLNSGIISLDIPTRKPTPELQAMLEALCDRLAALRTLLCRGALVARGTFSATGMEQTISAAQWRRSGLKIDVRNSDLFDKATNSVTPVWTGIMLWPASAPSAEFGHVVVNQQPEQLTPTVRSPRRKNIERVETRASSQTECAKWLEAEMRRQPLQRVGTKDSWWEKARKRWPNSLSRNAFNQAWATAIRNANAPAWAASGAPRKSSKI